MREFTPEMRAKALEARKAKLAASQHLRRDWADSDLWDSIAKSKGVKLPVWSKAPTPRLLKRWHEILEKTPFHEVYGCSPSKLIVLNPHVPLRAFVGQMLERVA